MMIDKRLLGLSPESKKYIARNVLLQWLSPAANIGLMTAIARLLARLFTKTAGQQQILLTVLAAAICVTARFFCTIGVSRMSYLSGKTIKKTLREKIYGKLLRPGGFLPGADCHRRGGAGISSIAKEVYIVLPDMKYDDHASSVTENRYRIFSGIEIIFFGSHKDSFELKCREKMADNIFEITHCSEGRLEYDLNGNYCYLMPGDLAVTQTNKVSAITRFPLKHYHGITIKVDLDHTPHCLSCFPEDVNVEPKELKAKFCESSHGFIVRSNPSIEHIFSELYHIPEKIRDGYLKVKILELFLFLSVYDTHANEFGERTYSAAQARLAREIGHYLTDHISEHVTLKEIAKHLHLSETHIKKTFQCVYGVTPRAFILEQKIESAAYMLEQTDKTVLDIANEHGYDNASKFAGVFRSIKGMSPNEYRNHNKVSADITAKKEQKSTCLE